METAIYRYELLGEFTSPVRGGVPNDIDALVKKKSKDVSDLYFQIAKEEVKVHLQAGELKKAHESVEKYETEEIEPHKNPLNIFKKDSQNGGSPYMGAHWFFGAFRDAAKFIFPEHFYGGGKKGAPSAKHLRKFVDVQPYHIFFHKPTYEKNNKNIVKVVDGVTGQQPSEAVGGFSRYEYIEAPIQFYLEVLISSRGPFLELLEDPDNVKEIIHQARNHRLGSCRSAGYGMWNIIKLTLKNGS